MIFVNDNPDPEIRKLKGRLHDSMFNGTCIICGTKCRDGIMEMMAKGQQQKEGHFTCDKPGCKQSWEKLGPAVISALEGAGE
jgi:hypothetical protein